MTSPESRPADRLEGLSVRELETLAKQAQEAATQRRRKRAEELLADLRGKADAEGLTLEEVLACVSKSRSAHSNGRGFANPENAGETWHGRGRRPQWVKDALASGRTLDDLRIA